MDIIKASYDKGYQKGFLDGMLDASSTCAAITADIIKNIFISTKIKNVIFNDPATIVFWEDGSKTVVKADEEPFDKEKGLAMAIAKKIYGNKGNYYELFKKYCPDNDDIPF